MTKNIFNKIITKERDWVKVMKCFLENRVIWSTIVLIWSIKLLNNNIENCRFFFDCITSNEMQKNLYIFDFSQSTIIIKMSRSFSLFSNFLQTKTFSKRWKFQISSSKSFRLFRRFKKYFSLSLIDFFVRVIKKYVRQNL